MMDEIKPLRFLRFPNLTSCKLNDLFTHLLCKIASNSKPDDEYAQRLNGRKLTPKIQGSRSQGLKNEDLHAAKLHPFRAVPKAMSLTEKLIIYEICHHYLAFDTNGTPTNTLINNQW